MASLAPPVTAHVFEGVIARVHRAGDPLIYADGIEYRDEAELKVLVDAVNSGIWITTLTHPNEMLDAGGGGVPVIGKLLSARVDGDEAVGKIMIDSVEGLAAIKHGIKELSLGYYSAIDRSRHQRRTRIDHLAIVPAARCGGACRLRTDAAEHAHADCGGDQACACSHVDEQTATTSMRRIVAAPDLDGEVLVPEPRADVSDLTPAQTMPVLAGDDLSKEPTVNLEQALAALSAANEKVGAEKARADKADEAVALATAALAQAKKDAEEAVAVASAAATQAKKDADDLRAAVSAEAEKRAADAVQAKKDADEAIETRVNARVAVMTAATVILPAKAADGSTVDRSKMDDATIMREIVKHVDGLDVPADQHPAYIRAMFDGAIARHAKTSAANGATRQALAAHVDAALPAAPSTNKDPERAIVDANRDTLSTAWQTPARKDK